jgi:ribosomal-protein-alanine N-acetyltransferase
MTALRVATDSDIAELLRLERECFTPPWTEGQLLREIYGGDSTVTLACDGGAVIGFSVLRHNSGECELLQIAVTEGKRGRGVGFALLGRALTDASSRGDAAVFLEVREHNGAAVALYEKRGFARVGKRPGYYDSPTEDAVIMRRVFITRRQ